MSASKTSYAGFGIRFFKNNADSSSYNRSTPNHLFMQKVIKLQWAVQISYDDLKRGKPNQNHY